MSIILEDISCSLGGKEILKEITLELEEKKLIMLLGLNGSGKSTFMRILLGFLRPDRGKVWYNKKCLDSISIKERSKMISYMPQSLDSDMSYTVKEFVLLGVTPYLEAFQTPDNEAKEQVKKTLREFHLEHLSARKMYSLSGGERQMAYFARTRVQRAPWMVLDEPMASLDYLRQHEFMEQLAAYNKTYQQGILISVHDPGYALAYADQVILLNQNTVMTVLCREEENFNERLTKELNQIYKNHLELVSGEKQCFYGWREEKFVSV